MRALITATAVLVLSVNAFSQSPTKITKTPAPDTNAASGVDMFRSYCASCHGVSGKGDGPAASALKKPPADLTLLSKKNNGKFPVFAVQKTIQGDPGTLAHGSNEMPVWGDIFRDMRGGSSMVQLRVKNLSDYIETLQQK